MCEIKQNSAISSPVNLSMQSQDGKRHQQFHIDLRALSMKLQQNIEEGKLVSDMTTNSTKNQFAPYDNPIMGNTSQLMMLDKNEIDTLEA